MRFSRKLKRGAGELLGFALMVPFIMMLLCAVLSSAQITVANQQLTYAAYSAGRAAVVAESEDLASERAEAVLDVLYGDRYQGISFTRADADALGLSLGNGEVYCKIQYLGTGASWIKGDVIKCTVYQNLNPIMPFTAGVRAQSVVMMIENGELPTEFFN